ncbi:NADH-quinone oxidoreductase subunit E [Trebonia kvetii]|uniref:NADH-quinone oxidoreductase subunit E n=1 Tax=Trebonia kvetii TaxID=2480626 RepID=A0A6P2BLJ7_9ACTN|nr:NAD(P)H-dependent oxidoreductase subunit E [Trebonia kvetii]TVY98935.1 NADH-quinone oxidoreductase subunit E [Trebonia kvetii]
MDLRLTAKAAATDAERAAVDEVLGPPASQWEGGERRAQDAHVAFGGRAARDRRHLLITVLHAVQEQAGWISPGALDYVSQRLTVPPAEAYGVASFYALFRTSPAPGAVVHVCDDVACQVAGAEELCAEMTRRFGHEGTESALNGPMSNGTAVTWQRSPCLGKCDRGSAALIQRAGAAVARRDIAPVTPDAIWHALTAGESPAEVPLGVLVPQLSQASSRTGSADSTQATAPAPAAGTVSLLRRLDHIDPSSLGSYRAAGGYEMLRRAITLGPQGIIREVRDAKLMGRGGAAFPTHIKWDAVAGNPVRPHYVVCNADESEPGTFKDRVMLEADPYALVEALTIMGHACGAEQGYIYIRGEYPTAEARLAHAIGQARAHGFLGADVLGAGFAFDIEIRRGAGAYIAGEETALINSIEGKRAEPRNKPPFPAQSGLFGKPTAVNNVETLLSVLEILRVGGPAFAAVGTEASTGTRLFCLSGCVAVPGLYEYDFGVTLRDVIDGAGGVAGGRPLRAVLLGGAAGVFVGPEALDMPLTFEGVRAAGATLGSGVVLVLDDTVDLTALLRRITQFFRDESCGQCVPCRVGTVRQEELVARLVSGTPLGSVTSELALLSDIGSVARDASICGLGQTALSAVESAVKLGLIGADS